MNSPHNRPNWARLDRDRPETRFPDWATERPARSVQELAGHLHGLEVVASAEDITKADADRRERQRQARQWDGLGAVEPGE